MAETIGMKSMDTGSKIAALVLDNRAMHTVQVADDKGRKSDQQQPTPALTAILQGSGPKAAKEQVKQFLNECSGDGDRARELRQKCEECGLDLESWKEQIDNGE